jgi:hypothetical protein
MPVDGQEGKKLDRLYLQARAHAAARTYYIMSEKQSKKVGLQGCFFREPFPGKQFLLVWPIDFFESAFSKYRG